VSAAPAGPRGGRPAPRPDRRERGQALVEVAMVLPLLLLLAVGVVAVGRIVSVQAGVAAVAREAARSAALADTPSEAAERGLARGAAVAAGYGLTGASFRLEVDPGRLERGGVVRAEARYGVGLADLPLLGWASVPVRSLQVEPIDPYRSRWTSGGGP
jgi:hypothetical protein